MKSSVPSGARAAGHTFDPSRSAQPATRAMWNALADGAWHHLDDILPAGAESVMPGRALRRQLSSQQRSGATLDQAGVAQCRGAGGRALAREGMAALVRAGRVERRTGPRGDVEYRRTDLPAGPSATGPAVRGRTRRLLDPDRLTPVSRAAWEALADGAWHRELDAVVPAAKAVPSGRAVRRAGGLRDGESGALRVAMGQRAVALDAVRGLVRTGRLEQRRTPTGDRELRRAPRDR
jgi:hypothetical protein